MPAEDYAGVWTSIYATIRAFWALTEPRIHAAAQMLEAPMELYYCAELGLDVFSVHNFQERDPYSNPAQYPALFAKLTQGEWILPQSQGEYRVTESARTAARSVIRAGDDFLESVEVLSVRDLQRMNELLQRLVKQIQAAPEPPPKWAILKRFRVADEASPLLAQIREALMDLFAYRDDSHRAAWRTFPVDGLSWNTFGMLWDNTADTPADMARQAAFRGYTAEDYRRALDTLTARGWVTRSDAPDTFVITPIGKKLRDVVEQLTDAYFYIPWASLSRDDLVELLQGLRQLRERLEAVVLAAH
ncbi:MAG: hypothetical protein HY741_09710 [Chloroflexi bacterium]|nr:hypothetical protein [Chloroflexota bacterium]